MSEGHKKESHWEGVPTDKIWDNLSKTINKRETSTIVRHCTIDGTRMWSLKRSEKETTHKGILWFPLLSAWRQFLGRSTGRETPDILQKTLNWGDRNLSSRNMRSLEFVRQGVRKQSYKEEALAICIGAPLSLLLNTELKMRLHVARLRTPWEM